MPYCLETIRPLFEVPRCLPCSYAFAPAPRPKHSVLVQKKGPSSLSFGFVVSLRQNDVRPVILLPNRRQCLGRADPNLPPSPLRRQLRRVSPMRPNATRTTHNRSGSQG